jgi:hypothetical protein
MAFFVALNYFTCGLWNHPSPCILPVKTREHEKDNKQAEGLRAGGIKPKSAKKV